ncbi:uncharacterized protein LOC143013025 isoform X2 [Genypterus blacodes]|uniref:uncharacterized protein LOC143013025 isoform X2 n=1 Tax=Genypterus blacodes TaxID=154954 RepID=UPI003F771DDA
MSFLAIPSQSGLFTTIKSSKSADDAEDRSAVDDEDEDENDDDSQAVRLIPRCSPVPRKRGQSIHDETAEYMQIHATLSAGKKVSFADLTGGDLADVKEFVAFDSDEEEDRTRWEEEEAKYRKPVRQPTYCVQPEFIASTGGALMQAVHANKLEVEQLMPAENEPLAFTGIIRVLNISFHKAVYIRSTMDSWVTYFDHPAQYVQGSHDGDTDKFFFKLSFAPPYTTHGSRIEFVVRYETNDGDYWCNNSHMNYVVTLLLSYEDDAARTDTDLQQVRGILKPQKDYSMNNDFDDDDDDDAFEDEEEVGNSKPELFRPTVICPVVFHPEMDLEIAVHPSGPVVPPGQELPSADSTLSVQTSSPGEQSPCMSSETTLQTNDDSSFVHCASESVQTNKSQLLPRLHQISEQSKDSSPSALLSDSSLLQETRRSDSHQGEGEEIPHCVQFPTTESNLWPTEEDGLTHSPAGPSSLELPVSDPDLSSFEGSGELAGRLSQDSTDEERALSAAGEQQAPPGAEGQAQPSAAPTENTSARARGTGANSALPSIPDRKEEEDYRRVSPDTLLENLPAKPSSPQSERDAELLLIPSIVFLSGVVTVSIALQEPRALFLIGLFLVLLRF